MSDGGKEMQAGDGAVVAGRGALYIGFAKAFFMASGFVQNVLLTRILGAADFGVYSVVTKYVSIVNNAVVQSTIQAVSKFTAEDDDRAAAVKRAGLRMQIVLGTALGLAFFLGAPLIAAGVNAPGHTRYFRVVALIPFLYAFYSVFVGSANGLRRFRAQAGFDVGFSTAKTILVLGAAALAGVGGAFGGFVAAAAVILIVSAKVMGIPSARQAAGSDFTARRLFVFMGEVVAYGLILNLALNYDILLLRRIAGASAPEIADTLAGNYEALRTLALLPYQALIVITFVVFPLVSRATFADDRAATAAYVTQALRYAVLLAGAMGVVLAARPETLLGILYKPEYGQGAAALPVLVVGQCCLALTAVACAIMNAAGRVRVALALVGTTVAIGAIAALAIVDRAAPGSAMLLAMATAATAGMVAGFIGALVVLRAKMGGGPPTATLMRVGVAVVTAALAGRFVPGAGKIAGLAAIAVVGVVYAATLLVLRELGPDDRARALRILRRR